MNTTMKLPTLSAVIMAAALLAGTAPVSAEQSTPPFGPPMAGRMMGMGGMMGARFADPATLDAVKTRLGITAAQEDDWNAYVKVVTETADSMRASREAMWAASPQDRVAMMSGMHQQHLDSFTAVSKAADTLLGKLDDGQKAQARFLLPGLAGPGFGMHAGLGMRGMGMMGMGGGCR